MDVPWPATGETAPHPEERSPDLPQPIRPPLNMDPDQAMYAPRANIDDRASTNVGYLGSRQHEHPYVLGWLQSCDAYTDASRPYPALSSATHGTLPPHPFQPSSTFQQPRLHSSIYGVRPATGYGTVWSPMPMAPPSGFEHYASASVFEDAGRIYRSEFHNTMGPNHNHMNHQRGKSVHCNAEEEEEEEEEEEKRKGKGKYPSNTSHRK